MTLIQTGQILGRSRRRVGYECSASPSTLLWRRLKAARGNTAATEAMCHRLAVTAAVNKSSSTDWDWTPPSHTHREGLYGEQQRQVPWPRHTRIAMQHSEEHANATPPAPAAKRSWLAARCWDRPMPAGLHCVWARICPDYNQRTRDRSKPQHGSQLLSYQSMLTCWVSTRSRPICIRADTKQRSWRCRPTI